MKNRVINITTKLGRAIAVAGAIMVAVVPFTGITIYAATCDMGGAIYSENHETGNENANNYGGAIYSENIYRKIDTPSETGGAIFFSEKRETKNENANNYGGAIYSLTY